LPTRTPQTSSPGDYGAPRTGGAPPRRGLPVDRSGEQALVIGGTGPSGPDVVHGLLKRGFETTVFHGGVHEVPLPDGVRHIHGDPHFRETIAEALGNLEFDVVIAQYGRLRHISDHLRGRAGHVVAIGGAMSPLAAPSDRRWGPLGRPAIVREHDRHMLTDAANGTLGFRIAQAAAAFLEAGANGGFRATYIAYPTLYGPRQPGSPEWSIVRRLRDQRRRIIVPDGGLRIESRAFVRNVAAAPLLAIDWPSVAEGRSYVVTDREVYTVRQRIEFIARHLGADVDLVDMPYALATPCHAFYRQGPGHRVTSGELIRDELGYTETFDAATGLAQTVEWLMAAPEVEIDEIESQLGDPFDYDFEDALIAWWEEATASPPPPSDGPYRYSHVYRHPSQVGEAWRGA
jgi:nucleoside-diphosphate-sugar epimerase